MNKFIVAVIVATLATSAFAQVPRQLPRPDSTTRHLNLGMNIGSIGRSSVAWIAVGYRTVDHAPDLGRVRTDSFEVNAIYGRSGNNTLFGFSGSRLFGVSEHVDLKFCMESAITRDYRFWANGFGVGGRYHMNRYVAFDLNLMPFGLSRAMDVGYANLGVTITL